MSVKTILTEPNNILRQVSKKVEKVGDKERVDPNLRDEVAVYGRESRM